MTTETRTFIGGTDLHVFDGWCGFHIGQTYELTYTREFEQVTLQLPHVPNCSIQLSQEHLNAWFKKV